MKTIYDEFPDYDEFDEEGKLFLRNLFETGNYFRFNNDKEFKNYANQVEENTFASIVTNKSFNEISNEIAMESPFGESSIFYKPSRKISYGSGKDYF